MYPTQGLHSKSWLRGSGSNRPGLAAAGYEPAELPTTHYLAIRADSCGIRRTSRYRVFSLDSPRCRAAYRRSNNATLSSDLGQRHSSLGDTLLTPAVADAVPHVHCANWRTVWDSNPSDRLERPGISTRNRTVQLTTRRPDGNDTGLVFIGPGKAHSGTSRGTCSPRVANGCGTGSRTLYLLLMRQAGCRRPLPAVSIGLHPTTPLMHSPRAYEDQHASDQIQAYGAESEFRTRDLNLGKVALYQLSYFRIPDDGVLLRQRAARFPGPAPATGLLPPGPSRVPPRAHSLSGGCL